MGHHLYQRIASWLFALLAPIGLLQAKEDKKP